VFYLLPSLANIAALLFLMMFIYAVLGINLFAGIKLQSFTNEYANFQDLWSSINVLIRIAFGQDWPYFMHELANPYISGCIVNTSILQYVFNNFNRIAKHMKTQTLKVY